MLIIMSLLFMLYALPLFIIGITAIASSGFTEASGLVEFSVALSGVYLGPTRDTLGTFVVPFITAYAATSLHKGIGIERETMGIFIVLVALFVLAALVFCEVQMHADILVGQLNTINQEVLKGVDEKLKNMSEAYIKEILGYISLLLGITQTSRTNDDG